MQDKISSLKLLDTIATVNSRLLQNSFLGEAKTLENSAFNASLQKILPKGNDSVTTVGLRCSGGKIGLFLPPETLQQSIGQNKSDEIHVEVLH